MRHNKLGVSRRIAGAMIVGMMTTAVARPSVAASSSRQSSLTHRVSPSQPTEAPEAAPPTAVDDTDPSTASEPQPPDASVKGRADIQDPFRSGRPGRQEDPFAGGEGPSTSESPESGGPDSGPAEAGSSWSAPGPYHGVERLPAYDEPAPSRRMFVGGYGAMGLRFGPTAGRMTSFLALDAGVLIGQRVSVGLAYAQSVYRWGEIRGTSGRSYQLGMSHGGVRVGVTVLRRGAFGFAVHGTLGGGTACVYPLRSGSDHQSWDGKCEDRTLMFVAEPGISIYAHVARWMRIGFDAGARLVAHRGWERTHGVRLSGPYFGINVGFGWFPR